MMDVLGALLPPAVVGGVVIAFVVYLFRTQRTHNDEPDQDEADTGSDDERNE